MVKKQAKKKKASGVLALAMACMIMLSMVLVFFGTGDVSANEIPQRCGMECTGSEEMHSTMSLGNIRTPAEWETTERVLILPTVNYNLQLGDIGIPGENTDVEIEDVSHVFTDPPHGFDPVPIQDEFMFVRDYGPLSVMFEVGERYYRNVRYNEVNSPLLPRDEFTQWYATKRGEVFTTHYDVKAHGGDFMIDSGGFHFYSSYWEESWNNIFGIYGSHKVHNESCAVHSHIDMFAKFVSENTVIIAERVTNYLIQGQQKNLTDEQGDILDDVATFFESAKARNGQPYEVIRVPAWFELVDDEWKLISYTNSLIVNDKVIIPTYDNHPQKNWNSIVFWKYVNALPNHDIAPIYTPPEVIGLGGMVHCATMQIPKRNRPPVISDVDVKLDLTNNTAFINATITDQRFNMSEEDWEECTGFTATLYYRNTDSDLFIPAEFYHDSGDNYIASSYLDPEGDEYEYFIHVEDSDKAVSYYGDAWEPKTFEPHVNIYEPSQGHTLWPTVNIYWESNTLPGVITHYSIRCKFDSDPWGDWYNTGMYTNHTYTDMAEGEWSVQVRVTTYDSETYTDFVTFTVSKPPPHVEITQPIDQQVWPGNYVIVGWKSDTHPDAIDYFTLSRGMGPFWFAVYQGKNTSHLLELPDGWHTLRVHVRTIFDDSIYDEVTFYVDGDGGPDSVDDNTLRIKEDTVFFTWDLEGRYDDDIWYYEVQLNYGEWLNLGASTHHTFRELEDGKNIVTVRMKDSSGTVWQDSVVLLVGDGPP